MQHQGVSSNFHRRTIALVVAATVVTVAIARYGISQFAPVGADDPSQFVDSMPQTKHVTALGRLEPASEVVQVSAPLALDGDRVAQLRVQLGDRVEAGQIIAVLDSHQRLQAAVQEAQQQVQTAEWRLAQVKAGAKNGEIQAQAATVARFQAERQGELAAQSATIARWQAEVQHAQAEYDRFQQLYQAGAVSASHLDAKRLALATAKAQWQEAIALQQRTATTLQAQVREATATLDQVTDIRPVDVQVAQAELNEAIAAVQRAKTELEQAYVYAPITGTILTIHTQPGEKVSDNGIVDLGQTEQMMAIAEVYQTDIDHVRVGQAASITSQAFSEELRGTVLQIGSQVNRQRVMSTQPGENLDQRVIEVKIRLSAEASKRVANLTHLQVQVAIQR
ncbi:biotin/lipoyl-binding protein [Oculatella sp. LEGE 06141]|uniref:HlyD family efflux transporter periplasmic adaptor subunit n=1 Tax=Oculatella sp. LEGE 06141 TaxID=1828648 RepID=UPI00187EF41F|nr:HlyD family efflux transporter periplasmic adaptor subunit [Oculatella sp. LEGE 06141]MBE9179048.1 biotin/lipoyl-binding protein [Oculatella sp. LEGE 06141]